MARFNLPYATLSQVNPRLVYCSIAVFGQTGPRAHSDPIFQAMNEGMSIADVASGQPGVGPNLMGFSIFNRL